MDPFEALVTSSLGLGVVVVVALWSAVWKLFALYRAGCLRQKGWFVALFFLNTVGILEIVYLFVVSKKSPTTE